MPRSAPHPVLESARRSRASGERRRGANRRNATQARATPIEALPRRPSIDATVAAATLPAPGHRNIMIPARSPTSTGESGRVRGPPVSRGAGPQAGTPAVRDRFGAMRTSVSLSVAAALAATLARPAAAAPTVERQIEVRGTTRSYLVHAPSSGERARPMPVLFVFHGAGSSAEDMVQGTGLDALGDESGIVVVYPKAPADVLRYEVDPPAGRVSADVELFDAILARLRERFPVDERRIYATGFSNGAAFCYRLAAERPDVVAAIAPVAGYLPQLVRSAPVAPIPLLHVHGTAD